MITILGKLIDINGSKYKAHSVLGPYNENTAALEADLEKGEHVWKLSYKQVNVQKDGSFLLHILNKSKMSGPLLLQVVAPDGGIPASKEGFMEDLRERITINVDARVIPNIIESDDLFLSKRVKITGRVTNAKNKQLISNKQVPLWTIPELESTSAEDGTDNRFEVVLVRRTDEQRYFSREYLKRKSNKTYGITDVGNNKKVTIRLGENTFPKKMMLAVSAQEEEEGVIGLFSFARIVLRSMTLWTNRLLQSIKSPTDINFTCFCASPQRLLRICYKSIFF